MGKTSSDLIILDDTEGDASHQKVLEEQQLQVL